MRIILLSWVDFRRLTLNKLLLDTELHREKRFEIFFFVWTYAFWEVILADTRVVRVLYLRLYSVSKTAKVIYKKKERLTCILSGPILTPFQLVSWLHSRQPQQ